MLYSLFISCTVNIRDEGVLRTVNIRDEGVLCTVNIRDKGVLARLCGLLVWGSFNHQNKGK